MYVENSALFDDGLSPLGFVSDSIWLLMRCILIVVCHELRYNLILLIKREINQHLRMNSLIGTGSVEAGEDTFFDKGLQDSSDVVLQNKTLDANE